MSEAVEKPTVESLIDSYGIPDEPLIVTLPRGEQLQFKRIGTFAELNRFLANCDEWVSSVRHLYPDAWQPYMPSTEEELRAAFMIAELSMEPKFEHLDALKIVKKLSGWATKHILGAMDKTQMRYQILQREIAEVEVEKKGSNSTDGNDSGSDSVASISLEETPTI